MTFHILLLPKEDYWSWVRASRDYLLAFGGNLSPDPEVVLRSPYPDLVVLYPDGEGAFPHLGDPRSWFSSRRPSLRLSPISASTPDDFASILQARVDEKDPYGDSDRPISLVWPTDYPVITQAFGANPHIYGRYGLPGHEGVDLRALPNTNVYACADGEVYQVYGNPRGHVYGIHVRIRHRDGYKTTYGHLARPLVRVGEPVRAGQVIGKADSTGASNASHLHLLLKKDGATDRAETTYPRDIIDPTPFLIWPGSAAKAVPRWEWPAGRCLVGAVGRPGDVLRPADLDLVVRARLEAVAVERTERTETLRRLRLAAPGLFVLARIGVDPSGEATPAAFLERIAPDVERLYTQAIRYFEIQPNPNLQSSGWGWGWQDGAQFAIWFQAVRAELKAKFPESRVGFPCLSPGGDIVGLRTDSAGFVEQAAEAAAGSDWVGAASFWQTEEEMESESGEAGPSAYRLRFPDQLVLVTEFGNASPAVNAERKAEQYLTFYRRLGETPGVGAAFAFALSCPRAHPALVWRSEDGRSSGIPERIGRRVT